MLKLIQLGLTFSDEKRNLPTCGTEKFCIWQFNFKEFDVGEDVNASDSIGLLKECGIDFKKNIEMGIDSNRFAELLMLSGIVLNDCIKWVTFHSGYDFGYLLKLLSYRSLPETQTGFFDLINLYFPMLYDIKHLMKFSNSLHGGVTSLPSCWKTKDSESVTIWVEVFGVFFVWRREKERLEMKIKWVEDEDNRKREKRD